MFLLIEKRSKIMKEIMGGYPGVNKQILSSLFK